MIPTDQPDLTWPVLGKPDTPDWPSCQLESSCSSTMDLHIASSTSLGGRERIKFGCRDVYLVNQGFNGDCMFSVGNH